MDAKGWEAEATHDNRNKRNQKMKKMARKWESKRDIPKHLLLVFVLRPGSNFSQQNGVDSERDLTKSCYLPHLWTHLCLPFLPPDAVQKRTCPPCPFVTCPPFYCNNLSTKTTPTATDRADNSLLFSSNVSILTRRCVFYNGTFQSPSSFKSLPPCAITMRIILSSLLI